MINSHGELSLEQKAALVSGDGPWSTASLPELGVQPVRLSDGPHGLRVMMDGGGDNLGLAESARATCFPPAVAVGSSWDPVVAERIGAAIAREARAAGVDIVLGPGVNIKRSPLCGRNFEYLSEDPLVSGVLGAAFVRSLQAGGVGASVKHFAANNQETDRMRVSSDVDERTLREIYFPAFERVVREAQPATVMCSYNRVNGIFSSENRWLLTDVLRNEWGFGGAVVSDWGAVHDPVVAVHAGVDLEMPGSEGRNPPIIAAAVRAGVLDEDELDSAVQRVIGLSSWRGTADGDVDLDVHHQLARQVAAQCAVLLKNDGALPLSGSSKLAVIGEFARTPRYQGGGSSRVNSTRTASFLDSVVEYANAHVDFQPGFTLDGSGDPSALRAAAAHAAAGADIALVFAGLRESDESEGYDRTTLELPADQVELIKEVAAAASRTVVVLSHGGVVSMEDWHDDVDAILDAFLLGQASGAAIADLLYGAVNPSGRLAETIPRRLIDSPSAPNFPGEEGHVLYGERVLVGYRGYSKMGRPVRYPFGHGLSYTTFRISEFSVHVTGQDSAAASVRVTNTGDRAGAHVVQIYVDATAHDRVLRPQRELRAFTKVFLEPGQTMRVELPLDRRAFAYWDVPQKNWVVAPGDYVVQLGWDAESIHAEQSIALEGDLVIRELTGWSTLAEWLEHPLVGPTLREDVADPRFLYITEPRVVRVTGTMPMGRIIDFLRDDLPEGTFEALMAKSVAAPRPDIVPNSRWSSNGKD
ncbi:glycoside hydrolase family 3 C-terminal domain-containing protein [Microbacterium sp. B35-30]|uniref:glycoside hydrolase family 3 C-terminal domain-containing protein n=1 Tax=Microbacterium sp. B35-30 TaxID=1962642 RepID=UPI001EF94864|nr:glycoside hydrolase family 3 C-terminal domain-containing protein [Microbacterium sp. B35-30]